MIGWAIAQDPSMDLGCVVRLENLNGMCGVGVGRADPFSCIALTPYLGLVLVLLRRGE